MPLQSLRMPEAQADSSYRKKKKEKLTERG